VRRPNALSEPARAWHDVTAFGVTHQGGLKPPELHIVEIRRQQAAEQLRFEEDESHADYT
jgi:hypothetical protein